MGKVQARFQIGGIVLSLKSERPFSVTPAFCPFLTERGEDYVVSVRYKDVLPAPTGRSVYRDLNFALYADEAGNLTRCFYDLHHNSRLYAVSSVDWHNRTVEILCLNDAGEFFTETDNCLFHAGWEELMRYEQRLLLHACAVSTELGGILFSGPSGIGKSTQGDLWCRYASAKLLNGDRPILAQTEQGWRAFGSPYAGSSNCHVNESTTIRAIVVLQQAPSDRLRRLGTAEAFHRVFAQVTASPWNRESVAQTLELTEKLVCAVPVYELCCTPTQTAVNLLRSALEEETP